MELLQNGVQADAGETLSVSIVFNETNIAGSALTLTLGVNGT